jgi:hypothetical protein
LLLKYQHCQGFAWRNSYIDFMFKYLQYAFFAVVAVFIVTTFVQTSRERESSKTWPTVTGHLVSAHVKEVREEDTTTKWTHRRHYFQVKVKYSYEVDGRTYTGDRVKLGSNRFSTEKQALDELARVEGTRRFTVLYNPKTPQASFLEIG